MTLLCESWLLSSSESEINLISGLQNEGLGSTDGPRWEKRRKYNVSLELSFIKVSFPHSRNVTRLHRLIAVLTYSNRSVSLATLLPNGLRL